MDKTATPSLEQRLKGYSALAGGLVLAAGAVDAQVVYTDVDPDQTVTGNGSTYMLDLNNDGTDDYSLAIAVQTGTYGGGLINYSVQGAGIITLSSNSIAGYSGSYAAYATQFSFGDTIDDGQNFIPAPAGTSSAGGALLGAQVVVTGLYSTTLGQGQFIGQNDAFIGLKLLSGGNTHYGWARVDVAIDGSSFTIKDYAYNSAADQLIVCGDTGGGVISSINPNDLLKDVNTYYYNRQLMVEVGTSFANDGEVVIVNTSGQEVESFAVSSGKHRFDLSNLASGVYMVNTRFAEGQEVKKIMVR